MVNDLEGKVCFRCGKPAEGKNPDGYICIDCLFDPEYNKDVYLTDEQVEDYNKKTRSVKEIDKEIENVDKEIEKAKADLKEVKGNEEIDDEEKIKSISEELIVYEESGTITKEQFDKLKPTKKDDDEKTNITDFF